MDTNPSVQHVSESPTRQRLSLKTKPTNHSVGKILNLSNQNQNEKLFKMSPIEVFNNIPNLMP